MIAGLQAYNPEFLAGLSATEAKLSTINKQLSSGYRVNQASDDPSAVGPILAYQGQLDHLTQVTTNLNTAQTEAQTADGALQTASSLLDQLVTLGAQGANSTSDPSSRAVLGQKVQQIEQELVAVANTTVSGRYIFGGDDPSTSPYTFDWSGTNGVTQNSTPSNTAVTRDSDGNSIVPRMTAQQIFDARDSTGAPAAGNIFAAAHALGTALLANNQTGINNAIDQVKAGVTQLGQSTTSYGNFESWLTQANQTVSAHVSNITNALSAVRDSDVAGDLTQLTLEQTALQAALAAHGTLNTKSLFSFLG